MKRTQTNNVRKSLFFRWFEKLDFWICFNNFDWNDSTSMYVIWSKELLDSKPNQFRNEKKGRQTEMERFDWLTSPIIFLPVHGLFCYKFKRVCSGCCCWILDINWIVLVIQFNINYFVLQVSTFYRCVRSNRLAFNFICELSFCHIQLKKMPFYSHCTMQTF